MSPEIDMLEDLPLTETTFLIMLSISAEPRHGYAIMKDVQELSEGRVSLSTGTLYGAIKRLLDSGWIVRVEEDGREMVQPRRFRKSYKLSRVGKRMLDSELTRMRSLIKLAKRRAEGAQA
jgi:DNA-binding PadR family transcriptional regulator